MNYREYYKSKGIDLDRVKELGLEKHNIEPDHIDIGARLLFHKVEQGLEIKNISIAHRIWAESKRISGKKMSLYKQIGELSARLDKIEKSPWYKFMQRYQWLFTEIKIKC